MSPAAESPKKGEDHQGRFGWDCTAPVAAVQPDERSAASGITTVARSVGAATSPTLAGLCVAHPGTISVPFFMAGGVKILYNLLLYRAFVSHMPDSVRAP